MLRCLTDKIDDINAEACKKEVYYFEKMEVCVWGGWGQGGGVRQVGMQGREGGIGQNRGEGQGRVGGAQNEAARLY